ncbi:28S ribosomal protein S31, mitochondrial [Halotydeus destructor]|nr:28S ribosomal protein S31, mitochondrial [Halotydeus destructor]
MNLTSARLLLHKLKATNHLKLPVVYYCDDSKKPSSAKESDLTEFKETEDKVAKAKLKLASLLSSMAVQKSGDNEATISLKLAKPVRPKRVEPKADTVSINDVSPGINDRLLKAAKTAAKSIGGEQWQHTKSELFKVLEAHDIETKSSRDGEPVAIDLSKIVSGMMVDKKPTKPPIIERNFRFQPPVDLDQSRRPRLPRVMSRERGDRRTPERVNIYSSESLAIFDPEEKEEGNQVTLTTWDKLKQEELKLLVTHPPTNAYEEMIRWTDQGKLWHYPISNEQGLDAESDVPFYEHVFLEQHLRDMPIKEGPIRQFMDVMVLGLSKNPYLTVDRKKAYLDWFKVYFTQKDALLKHVGAA